MTVVLALRERQEMAEVDLPEGSTALEAVQASGIAARHPQLVGPALRLGIWSRPCGEETLLRDGDRVEIYRALVADPKDQRRSRARLKPPARPRRTR